MDETNTIIEIPALPEHESMVKVLDKGYVRLVDFLGSDLSFVNAARASFAKESKQFSDADGKLINFLLREGHLSCFRHAFVTLEVRAPLMVARQWFKYVVGSDHTDPFMAWNENSYRYITLAQEFYTPNADSWRSTPEQKKQGSGKDLDEFTGAILSTMLADQVERDVENYEAALALGVAPEQARLFLPSYGLYVSWRWSASIQGVIHFLSQRLAHDAQKEIQLYARAVHRLVAPKYPVTFSSPLLGMSDV